MPGPSSQSPGHTACRGTGNHALQSPDRAHQHGNSKPRLCMRGGPLQSSISSFSLWPSPCPAQGALVPALHKAGHSLSTQLDLLLPRYAKSSSLQKTPTHLAWRGSPLSSPGSICRRCLFSAQGYFTITDCFKSVISAALYLSLPLIQRSLEFQPNNSCSSKQEPVTNARGSSSHLGVVPARSPGPKQHQLH